MQILESIGLALQAIWSNKLRSLMTVLGNIVAVTSIVAVVSLIQGMNAMVSNAIVSEASADAFTIQRFGIMRSDDDRERQQRNPLVTIAEADAIRRFSPAIGSVMAQAQQRASVFYHQQVLDTVEIQGVTSEYLNFATFNAERGRMMSAIEVDRNRPVALLGTDVAARLFGEVNPLDKIIQIRGTHFRVVGVSAKKGGIFGNSLDAFVVIPLGVHEKLFGARQSLALLIKPSTPTLLPVAMDDATAALRVKRHLKAREVDNFGIFTSDTLLDLYHQATNGIFAVLVGVVALSLVVGGIVIMNIMLMVVTERTREIGLRKALGARRRDIMWQVLTESVTLSTFGGLAGIFVGSLIGQAISSLTPLPARLEPWSVVLGIGITSIVGLVFGLYPASRAAALDPIEALRRE
ncbi:MAG: ABC transporter permease [Acidobacteria bacterium]|nr:MAG: ABC transporter permease [Acidobacteriota bacterium]